MMRKAIILGLSLAVSFFPWPMAGSKGQVKGVIYFADGNSLEFDDVVLLDVYINGGPACDKEGKTIPIQDESGLQSFSLFQLRSFKIVDFEVARIKTALGADLTHSRGKVEIQTDTGRNITCWYDQLSSIQVQVTDRKTGETSLRSIPLIKNAETREINVFEVVFSH